jgi:hypothetical protein
MGMLKENFMTIEETLCETVNQLRNFVDNWDCGNIYNDTFEDCLNQICFDLKRNLKEELGIAPTEEIKSHCEENLIELGYTVIDFDNSNLNHFAEYNQLTEYLEDILESDLMDENPQQFLDDNILIFKGILCPLTVTISHKIEISMENKDV